MPERLSNTLNKFWYEYDDFESFKNTFFKLKSLNFNEINKISINLKKNYNRNYSKNIISEKYLNIVNKILE